tara:strand:+ start:1643 stop:2239 length:597 start_codon:yes stop_codon:yes gene_type:complete
MSRAGKLKPSCRQHRKCAITGSLIKRKFLLRFVVSPDGSILPDLNQKLPGRGVWLTLDRAIIQKAIIKDVFSKTLRKKVLIPENLLANTIVLVKKYIVQKISLARKAGFAICGFDKVNSALKLGNVAILIQAIDGSHKEKNRLQKKIFHYDKTECLQSFELGMAFGRDNVIHAAILNGRFVENIKYDITRLDCLVGRS